MTRVEIARRLVAKACLAEAFRATGVRWWDSPTPPDSHGELGTVEEWRATDDWRADANRANMGLTACSGGRVLKSDVPTAKRKGGKRHS
jgi:hypothetical protein